MSDLVAPAIPPAACAILASAGWEIVAVEIDLHAGRAVMEIRRADGRWLYLAADRHGHASVERWQRAGATMRTSRRAASFDGVADTFLGRDRCEGPREALRMVAHYLANNPAPGYRAITIGESEATLALLLPGK